MSGVFDPDAAGMWLSVRVAEPPCDQLAALVDCVGLVEAAGLVRRGQVVRTEKVEVRSLDTY